MKKEYYKLTKITPETMPEEGTIVLGYRRGSMVPMLVYLNYDYEHGWIEATNVEYLSDPKLHPEYFMYIPMGYQVFQESTNE